MMENFIEFLYSKFLQSDGVSIDTRTVQPGNLFFALKGPNFNGNRYATQALEKGASFAVVDEKTYANHPQIILAPYSGEEVLQQLAIFHRKRFKRPVLGITGSNGKTTTKELISRVLAKKYNVHATKGNLNNHLGVPLTILELLPQAEIAIIEMGANHVGEIAALCQIAHPDLGLITNIGEAHTETFGGIEGVLRGKSELFDFLRKTDGKPFINLLDHRLSNMSKRFAQPGTFPAKDLELLDANPYISFKLGKEEVNTQLIGRYNFGNIAAAVSIGRHFGVDDTLINQAIAEYTPANQRSQIIQKERATIILDAYNANPTSMQAALDNLQQMPGNKSVILADMQEVAASTSKHKEIGRLLATMELVNILLLGNEMKYAANEAKNAVWFQSIDHLSAHLKTLSFSDQTVLIKGSRSMKLESIIDHIQ